MRLLALPVLAALASFASSQDKTVAPSWRPIEGAEHAWKIEIKFQAMGQDAAFSGTAKNKAVKVNADGSFELENWMEDGKVLIMGSEQEQPGEKTVVKYDKDGNPVEKHDFNSSIEEMLAVFSHVNPPAGGVTVGQKWAITDKFDRINKGEAEFLGTVDQYGKKCLAYKVSYSPHAGGASEGKAFIFADNGLLAGFDITFTKLQVAPGIESDGTASMKPVTK